MTSVASFLCSGPVCGTRMLNSVCSVARWIGKACWNRDGSRPFWVSLPTVSASSPRLASTVSNPPFVATGIAAHPSGTYPAQSCLTGNLGKTGLCRHPSRSAEGTRYGTILCLPRTAAVWGYRPLCRTGTVRSCLSGAQKYGKPTGEENESSKHRHFHRNGVIIEIHRLAGTFSDPLTNKRFQRLTRTYLHEDGYCFEKLKGTDVSLPPVNFDALFLFFTWLVISSTVVSVCDKCATGLFSCLPVRQTSTRNVCHGKSVFCIWKILAIIRRYRCRLSGIIRKLVS